MIDVRSRHNGNNQQKPVFQKVSSVTYFHGIFSRLNFQISINIVFKSLSNSLYSSDSVNDIRPKNCNNSPFYGAFAAVDCES